MLKHKKNICWIGGFSPMKKFKDIIEEITVFTVKNEDVPTTSVGNAPPGMVDEPIVRKKKKREGYL